MAIPAAPSTVPGHAAVPPKAAPYPAAATPISRTAAPFPLRKEDARTTSKKRRRQEEWIVVDAAKRFENYIKEENITGFQVYEVGDARKTTLFESELDIEGRRMPISVIIDTTAYATVRIQLAKNAIDDTNAMLLTGWLMQQNQSSRLIKFYLTSDTSIIADVVIPHTPNVLDPEVVVSVLRVFIRDISKLIPDLIMLLPEECAQT